VTAQQPEELIMAGQEMAMVSCPLLPENNPLIFRPNTEVRIGCTSCWRGYIGTWEIKDGYLYLTAVRGDQLMIGKPIVADWVSDILKIRKGKLLRYIHMGFASIYEQEIHIEIEKGKVINSHIIQNKY
jgi:hypothetical protein